MLTFIYISPRLSGFVFVLEKKKKPTGGTPTSSTVHSSAWARRKRRGTKRDFPRHRAPPSRYSPRESVGHIDLLRTVVGQRKCAGPECRSRRVLCGASVASQVCPCCLCFYLLCSRRPRFSSIAFDPKSPPSGADHVATSCEHVDTKHLFLTW